MTAQDAESVANDIVNLRADHYRATERLKSLDAERVRVLRWYHQSWNDLIAAQVRLKQAEHSDGPECAT